MMMKKRIIASMTAAVMMASAAAAVPAAADEETYFNTYLVADPTSMDSSKAIDTVGMTVLENVMEPLYRLVEKEDGSVEMEPAGAESYEVDETGKIYTFHLRDNTWSDGVPVTAADYAYAINRVIDPDTGSLQADLLYNIEGAEALDEKTLQVTLYEADVNFTLLMYHTALFPVREDLVEQYGDSYGSEYDNVVFCGPFNLTSWSHNAELTLVKSDTYWDQDSVLLDQVNIKIISEENAIYSSLESGSIDQASTSSIDWMNYFSTMPNLVHTSVPTASVYYQYFNQAVDLFSNEKIRKAITVAVDREELVSVVLDGIGEAAYGLIPTGVSVGETLYREEAENPISRLKEEISDPKALFIEGLEELGMDPNPENVTISLSLGSTDEFTKELGEYLQQVYKNVLGINVELDMQEQATFLNNWYNYQYEFGQMRFGCDYNDPMSLLSYFYSDMDGYAINWAGSERADELLSAVTVEPDAAARIEMIEELEDIVMYQDCVVSPLYYTNAEYFMYDYVKNYSTNSFVTSGFKYIDTSERP